MRKATRITYDPFTNRVGFKIAKSIEGPWEDLDDSSELLQYASMPVLFANCVTDIARIINRKQNSVSDGIEVQFVGPDSDFDALEHAAREESKNAGGQGPIVCRHAGTFPPSIEVLDQVRTCYTRIKKEFEDFLPGHPRYLEDGGDIGDSIVKFEETVSDAIPVCVIGNMSVGKSALINSLIGEEVLPSKENPTTARNTRIVESEGYSLTLSYAAEEGKASQVSVAINPGKIVSEESGEIGALVCDVLARATNPTGKSETQIMREVLGFLNDAPEEERDADFLSNVGWNITIGLPFSHSLSHVSDSPIILFDTPGSDNGGIDREKHDAALREFLGDQTNALPVLVTCRDQIVRQDTNIIRETIDRYQENFASPCCLVVLTKCDSLTKKQLEESVPVGIRNWHGKSIVLYTTPVGALGLRKDRNAPWLDDSYEEIFERWLQKQAGRTHVSLPTYNIYPCEDRADIRSLGIDETQFDTGIPSLEYEIAYYIDHYARYKKCVRGRKDLLTTLEKVKEMLSEQEREATKAKLAAVRKKSQVRQRLIDKLDEIALAGTDGMADRIAVTFEHELDEYVAGLSDALSEMYDEHSGNAPLDMDKEINTALRTHCQKNLIDPCYQRKYGAKSEILREMDRIARDYASDLQRYVENNDSHFSSFGSATLHEYLERELKMPEFSDVESILDSIAELFGTLALLGHGARMLLNRPGEAKAKWIHSKKGAFEGKLRGQGGLLGATRGVFKATVFDKPIERYYEQLERWAAKYKDYIKAQLDVDNAILSGMEDEIRLLDAKVSDLKARLEQLGDVQSQLVTILDAREVEG